MKHYYFGCNKQAGHFWFTSVNKGEYLIPHCSFSIPKELGSIRTSIDSSFCPADTEVEGISNLWLLISGKKRWTILSFWDHSVDSRPGSNSNFVIEGEHNFNKMINLITKYFPFIITRFHFDIKMQG